jgi:hypothetical protein
MSRLVWAVVAAALVSVTVGGIIGANVARRAVEHCAEARPRTTPDAGITVDWEFFPPRYVCVYGTGPTERREDVP